MLCVIVCGTSILGCVYCVSDCSFRHADVYRGVQKWKGIAFQRLSSHQIGYGLAVTFTFYFNFNFILFSVNTVAVFNSN